MIMRIKIHFNGNSYTIENSQYEIEQLVESNITMIKAYQYVTSHVLLLSSILVVVKSIISLHAYLLYMY